MSGIYIPGMEMPKRGHTVTLTIMGGGEAVVQYYDCKPQLTVPIVYKAVPIPDHGRLVDADALVTETINSFMDCADLFDDANSLAKAAEIVDAFVRDINDAPTVIPASKEKEG